MSRRVKSAWLVHVYGCCVVSERTSRGKPKMLKPYYFTHGFVSCLVGFPRVVSVKDGFARYLLCRIDLTIATRGLTALHDHQRGKGHQSLEIRYRLQKSWRLFTRVCKDASAPERARLVALVEGLPAVSLEPMFALSIDEVMAHEAATETSTEKDVVLQSTADRLWVCILWTVSWTVGTFLVWVAVARR